MLRRLFRCLTKKPVEDDYVVLPTHFKNEKSLIDRDGSTVIVAKEEIVPDKVTLNVTRRYDSSGDLLVLRAILHIAEAPLDVPRLRLLEDILLEDENRPFLSLLIDVADTAGTITLKEVRDYENDRIVISSNNLVRTGTADGYARYLNEMGHVLPLFWFHCLPEFFEDAAFGVAFQYISRDCSRPRYWA